jgi:hypothetical protein
MLQLAKAFLDIALWRRTPAQLPASLFLLVLVSCAAALLDVLGALLLPGPNDKIILQVVLDLGLPPAFAWAVLSVARRRQRFLQTAIALVGVDVLTGLLIYPTDALLRIVGNDRFASIPLGILFFAGLIWYLLACTHIWRAALDCGLILAGVISLGYFVLSIVLQQQLMPQP